VSHKGGEVAPPPTYICLPIQDPGSEHTRTAHTSNATTPPPTLNCWQLDRHSSIAPPPGASVVYQSPRCCARRLHVHKRRQQRPQRDALHRSQRCARPTLMLTPLHRVLQERVASRGRAHLCAVERPESPNLSRSRVRCIAWTVCAPAHFFFFPPLPFLPFLPFFPPPIAALRDK